MSQHQHQTYVPNNVANKFIKTKLTELPKDILAVVAGTCNVCFSELDKSINKEDKYLKIIKLKDLSYEW